MTYKPGQSGNPGGRPKAAASMARMIREATHDGIDLVKFAVSTLIGDESSPRDRQWACEWLADRGFGKAAQSVDLVVSGRMQPSAINLSSMSPLQLEALAALGDPEPDDD